MCVCVGGGGCSLIKQLADEETLVNSRPLSNQTAVSSLSSFTFVWLLN